MGRKKLFLSFSFLLNSIAEGKIIQQDLDEGLYYLGLAYEYLLIMGLDLIARGEIAQQNPKKDLNNLIGAVKLRLVPGYKEPSRNDVVRLADTIGEERAEEIYWQVWAACVNALETGRAVFRSVNKSNSIYELSQLLHANKYPHIPKVIPGVSGSNKNYFDGVKERLKYKNIDLEVVAPGC